MFLNKKIQNTKDGKYPRLIMLINVNLYTHCALKILCKKLPFFKQKGILHAFLASLSMPKVFYIPSKCNNGNGK